MKHKDDTSNMSCNLKYSAWIANRVASVLTTDTLLHVHMNYILVYINHKEGGIISTEISLFIFSFRNFFHLLPVQHYSVILSPETEPTSIEPLSGIKTYDLRVVPFT